MKKKTGKINIIQGEVKNTNIKYINVVIIEMAMQSVEGSPLFAQGLSIYIYYRQ